ncbi:TPA: YdgA family protein [Enterobacter cancerogenus]|uniref:YdgA family protein n=1 Tax=Enterobacter sp. TaxID=42895 RepID=UPI0032F2C795|nr:YdgA family protein [Enterobacter cancerogenus]HDR2167025.1 YdgA family protein [Enterobacter cancerogenus]HDR2269607.1 YdgA family protein [Enterobacter cancerogenus]
MKKSVVAVGVIVALGVVWTGASWFTGKQLEGRLAEMVAQANSEIKRSAPEAGVELSYQNYQRGVFTSHMDLVVKPVAGNTNALLKPGQSVVLNEVVSHGPFPLAQLKSFNLIPSMASVKTVLVKNDVTKQLFDIAKDTSPFEIETRISYSGDTSSDIALKALNYENGTDKVAFSGGHFQLDADRDGKNVSLSGEAQSGLVNAVNEYDQKVQLTFNNLKADGNSKMTSFDERIGDQKLSLEKLAIAVEGKEMAVLEGMDLDGKSDVSKDGKSINTQLDYTLKSLKVQNQDLGTGKLSLKIGNIDGAAWHQFSQKYSKESQALLTDAALQQNPVMYQQQAMAVLFNNLPILLKGEPVITVAPLSWKNSKGETTFNLSLFLKDPSTATAEAQTLAQELDRSVKSLDGKLAIPVDMATEFMTQIAKLEGYGEEDAGKLANQQVKGLAAMGQMFRITTLENNTIGASLQYTNGQVTLNGQKMPLEEFVGMFGMPSLGLPEPAAPAAPLAPPAPVAPQQ